VRAEPSIAPAPCGPVSGMSCRTDRCAVGRMV
jgi:hypothetical protein